jgi:putative multiple sugar transport system substrate-binding protein
MKKALATMLSAAMLGTLVSCGNTKGEKKDTPQSSNNSAGKKIGIAMPAQELERWNSDGEYLKNLFEGAGYKVELKFSNNDDTKQNNDIIGMIDDGVDLLLVAAVDGTRLAKTLESAKEKDIPVISYDRLIEGTSAITYYITFDNYEVGKLQAEFIKDALKVGSGSEPHNIELVAGDAADSNARYFFEGAYKELEDCINNGSLVIPSGKKTFERVATTAWLPENAKKDMIENLKKNYSDGTTLDAVLCSNDSTALGVVQAIESNYSGSNTPVITGQDGDIANLKNIVDKKQAMTVYKNLRDEASVAFEVCKTLLNGEIPAAAFAKQLSVDVKYDSEAYNNGVKYVQAYVLAPYVITEDNLQLLVNTGMYKWDSNNKYLEAVK